MSEFIMVKGVSFTEEDVLTVCENCAKLEAQRDFLIDELRKLQGDVHE